MTMTSMMSKRILTIWIVIGASVLVGCEAQSGHEKNVQAANDRWKAVRGSLVLPMAQRQFDTGDLDLAEKTLAEAITVDTENPQLYILAGRVALERGQLERGHHRLQTAIDLDPEIAEAYYFQGIVLQRWSKFDLALERYQKAFELTPDNAAYLIAQSEMLVALDRVDEARQQLTDKVGYFEQNAGIRVALGQLHVIERQFDIAADYFQQASLLEPDDTTIVEELALAQLASGQVDLAVLNLERLCSQITMSQRPDLRMSLAKAYMATGRTGDARAIYLNLTRHDPKDVDAWVSLGEIAWSNNDTASALLAANRVMALAQDRHEGYLLAGMVWHRRGRLDRALSMFDHAAEFAPKDAVPMILRGITLEQAKRPEEAAEAYAEALRREPSDPHARSLLAQVAGDPVAHVDPDSVNP